MIASAVGRIEDESCLTSIAAGFLVVDANVKVLTAGGIRVQRVGYGRAMFRCLFRFGAQKVHDVGRFTSFSVGLARPLAHSSVFVEDQTGRASNLVELTIRAEEELVADVAIGEVTVGSRTVGRLLGRLALVATFAIDVEGIVAAFGADGLVGEDETVGAELLRQDEILAFVVAIALDRISEETVGFGTLIIQLGSHC